MFGGGGEDCQLGQYGERKSTDGGVQNGVTTLHAKTALQHAAHARKQFRKTVQLKNEENWTAASTASRTFYCRIKYL